MRRFVEMTILGCGFGALLALLFACSGNADLVKALAADPATVKIDITSPWGSFHLDRSNPTAVQVPIQVVPVPMGAATVTAPPVR